MTPAFLTGRSSRILLLFLLLSLLLPLLICTAAALSQRSRFRSLADTKAQSLAENAARFIEEAQLPLTEGSRFNGPAFGGLFLLSNVSAGDDTRWAVYTLDGTQAAPVAVRSLEEPQQRDILTARSEGVSLVRRGSVSSAIALIYRSAKPVGFVFITVDCSAYHAALRRAMLQTLLSFAAAAGIGLLVFLLLGAIPRFRVWDKSPMPPESALFVLRHYGLRAALFLLVGLLVAALGLGIFALRTSEVYRVEEEEMLLQNAALDAVRLELGDRSGWNDRLESFRFAYAENECVCRLITAADINEWGAGNSADRALAAAAGVAAETGAILRSAGSVRALVPLGGGDRVLELRTQAVDSMHFVTVIITGVALCLAVAFVYIAVVSNLDRKRAGREGSEEDGA